LLGRRICRRLAPRLPIGRLRRTCLVHRLGTRARWETGAGHRRLRGLVHWCSTWLMVWGCLCRGSIQRRGRIGLRCSGLGACRLHSLRNCDVCILIVLPYRTDRRQYQHSKSRTGNTQLLVLLIILISLLLLAGLETCSHKYY
jgi:hypothetical protein